jgi:hypothetical protein
MTSAGTNKRRWAGATAIAALLCALAASLVVGVGVAAAEEGDAAPLRPIGEGGLGFPEITGPTGFEEYPMKLNLEAGQVARQVDPQTVAVEYSESGAQSYVLKAEAAHDVDGAAVPTTLTLSADDVITLGVHFKAGNPIAGGAPFAFPISGGPGWEGGWQPIHVELDEPKPIPEAPAVSEANPPLPLPEPVTPCTVPSLHGLSLRAAKARLRAEHCSLGAVHLAAGATAGKGTVAKQFRAAGARLGAGAPVAVKLAPR